MSTVEYTQLIISTIAMGLVVLVFGFAAPWYRTWAGWVLFGVKVSLFLIFLILALNEKDVAQNLSGALEIIVFPLTTITSLALLILMVLTQVSKFSDRTAELLFRKHERPGPAWDGVERRHQNLDADADGHGRHLESHDIQE